MTVIISKQLQLSQVIGQIKQCLLRDFAKIEVSPSNFFSGFEIYITWWRFWWFRSTRLIARVELSVDKRELRFHTNYEDVGEYLDSKFESEFPDYRVTVVLTDTWQFGIYSAMQPKP